MIKREKTHNCVGKNEFFFFGGGGEGGIADGSKLIKQTLNSVWPSGALLERSQPLEKIYLIFLRKHFYFPHNEAHFDRKFCNFLQITLFKLIH